MKLKIAKKLSPLFLSTAFCAFVFICSARVLAAERTLIFPIPHQLELTGETFVMDETVAIIVPEEKSDRDIYLARFLVRELSDKYGIAVKIESSTHIPEGRKVVVLGAADNPLIKQYSKANKLEISEKSPGAEGYLLQVSSNRIIVAGWDDPGAFFGLQSLRQLIDSGNGTKVPGVKVRDWPNLPFRGIRLYVPGPDNIAFFKRFLRDFMALYKFNKVIIEVNCMRLDRHPEVNAGWIEFAKDLQYSRSNRPVGIRGEGKTSSHYDAGDGLIVEKDDIKDIVEIANQNFIEVIPEIPSLTHAYYLLTRHPELSEYPGDVWPDTYCPSLPGSYELMFDVYDEYIEVMQPKMIHIGHDEWRMPLDVCPHCKDKNYFDLYAQDVNKIYDYMSQKGIKVAMWGDHLLESVRNAGPREDVSSTGIKYQKPGALPPSLVEESIPKDILVFNWFWVDQEKDQEVNDFGFRQLYGNFKPNISNWDERIQKIDLAGGAPSSWAATTEFNFGKDLLTDFLGCANLLWSTHTINLVDLPPIIWELMPSIRAGLSPRLIPSEDGNSVVPVDITSHFNLPADSEVFNVNLSTLKSGEVISRSKVFNLANPAEASGKVAVAVGTIGVGENPLPAEVKGIPIGEDVSSLIFLHACALQSVNQKAYYNIPDFFDTADLLGWYEVVYEDGFSITVPVQYGVNILEWNPGGEGSLDTREGRTGSPQNAYCYEADPIQCSSDMENNPITLFAYEWVNPRFGKVIKEVNLHGTIDYLAAQPAGNPVTKPMPSNAIILSSISKVIKREPYRPTQDLSYSKPGSSYEEMANPKSTDPEEWAKVEEDVNVSFASDNFRYPKEQVPKLSKQVKWETTGWRGEKVHTQILVWTREDIPSVSFQVNDLIDESGNHITESNITAAFVRYVMSDDFGGGCADRDLAVDDSLLVADPLDIIDQLPVEANSVRPIWLSIQIPGEIPAGKYTGTIIINALEDHQLKISLNVLNHVLPPPDQWSYDLDIWQYAAPIARIHDVELWSDKHFELMRPYFVTLANAGQKVITANIIEQPWGLDHVHFDDPSLVKWTKKRDGTWDYDFSMFDRYVSFVMDCGISQRISCYSMITWDLSFIYYDEASGENKSIKLTPGTAEYTDYWSGMIEKFTGHLKEQGWFSKTAIAVDERPVEHMQAIIALLKNADPQWKIALAGDTYHPEIEQDIYDYCLASYLAFEDSVMIRRKAEGKPTTYYTACVEKYPNGYTFSPPAENAWLGWYASAKGYTGYLFWAYNTWVANPLQDARWKRYPSGTLFQFYPGPRTSIRFEKLIEGIQAFEKIRILREQAEKEGTSEKLKELDDVLATFELGKLDNITAAETVENARTVLNKY